MTAEQAGRFACEIEDHDASADDTPRVAIPDGKGGRVLVCEACLREMFETVIKPLVH